MANLILSKQVATPFSQAVTLPCAPFKVVVCGRTSPSPDQFAINIVENGNILFHMNPRWKNGRTVLNSKDKGIWGQEEYACFNSLTPNSNFEIVITCSNGQFKIQVNDEPCVIYTERLKTTGTSREVLIDKVNQNDIQLTLVQLTLL